MGKLKPHSGVESGITHRAANTMTNSFKNCLAASAACLGCLLFVALLGGAVAWSVFAIIALVNERHEPFDDLCGCSSHIWVYLLTLVVWTYMFGNGANNARASATKAASDEPSEAADVAVYTVYMLIDLGLISWGWWELRHADAHTTLGGLRVYKLSEAIVYAHTAVFALIVLAGAVLAYAAEFCCRCWPVAWDSLQGHC